MEYMGFNEAKGILRFVEQYGAIIVISMATNKIHLVLNICVDDRVTSYKLCTQRGNIRSFATLGTAYKAVNELGLDHATVVDDLDDGWGFLSDA